MPVKKEIVYPIFLECCKYTSDVFWEGIFEELAYAKPPYGTYINKNFLCCGYKNREFSYKIENKDPEILYRDVYDLLVNKLGILSQKEKAEKHINFLELEKSIKESRKEWNGIRKKNVKDTLYEKFAIKKMKENNLSITQGKCLLALITLSIMFKTITSHDIVYEDGEIQEIKGIEFSDGEVNMLRPLCFNTTQQQAEPVHIARISDIWQKYIENLKKC